MKKNIVVLGSGAWGTALCKHLTNVSKSANVTLWCRRGEIADSINNLNQNKNLPDIDLAGISATTHKSITKKADILLIAIPSQNIRQTLENVWVKEGTPVVICSKGIELGSLKLLGEVVQESLNVLSNDNDKNKWGKKLLADIMVLSGPTFAREVALKMPTEVTLGVSDLNSENTKSVKQSLMSDYFKVHLSTDIIGIEICGGIKNVIAIACGISVGRSLGDNAKAALITKSLTEIKALTVAMGGRADTILQMCAIGDLILTCSSIQSRNMSFGVLLGQGKTASEILSSRDAITEGVLNCKSINDLAKRHNVDIPVCKYVFDFFPLHSLTNKVQ